MSDNATRTCCPFGGKVGIEKISNDLTSADYDNAPMLDQLRGDPILVSFYDITKKEWTAKAL